MVMDCQASKRLFLRLMENNCVLYAFDEKDKGQIFGDIPGTSIQFLQLEY